MCKKELKNLNALFFRWWKEESKENEKLMQQIIEMKEEHLELKQMIIDLKEQIHENSSQKR